MQDEDRIALQEISQYLHCLLAKGMEEMDCKMPRFKVEYLSDELGELCKVLDTFFSMVHASYEYQKKIAAGDLAAEVDRNNHVAMPIRSLQASFKHLTWQASQVAKGDLNQEVHFLGEFADSFNRMIAALKEKEQLQNDLKRAQKLEAIGLMAGCVAHDLNNVLAGITGYPELLLLQLPESSMLRNPIEKILESGNRATGIVADLLTVARGITTKREPQNLSVLISECLVSPECEQLKTRYPNVLFAEQLDAEYSVITCSSVHILKILFNLLVNAAEAIGDNGSISIATSNQRVEQAEAREKFIKEGDYVVLSVQDDGHGISDKDLEHIFEPFYTRKVMGKSGTGLGLAIVWNAMLEHDGKVFVSSDENGTCFQLYFPVSDEKSNPVRCVIRSSGSGNGEHVLVVDDEPQLRDIACLMLRSMGYTVDTVSSGELALEFMTEKRVDMLVLDMQMDPGMNGHQTYKEILKLHPGQKAVIASGYSNGEDILAARRLGVCGFIQKPYSMTKLSQVIKAALSS